MRWKTVEEIKSKPQLRGDCFVTVFVVVIMAFLVGWVFLCFFIVCWGTEGHHRLWAVGLTCAGSPEMFSYPLLFLFLSQLKMIGGAESAKELLLNTGIFSLNILYLWGMELRVERTWLLKSFVVFLNNSIWKDGWFCSAVLLVY